MRPARPYWTDREISRLRELAATNNRNDVAKLLGRSKVAISIKARRLGIEFSGCSCYADSRIRSWSKEEVRKLTYLIGYNSVFEIATKLNRSEISVKSKVYSMGLSFRQGTTTLREVAELLGISTKTTRRYASKLKLRFRRKDSTGFCGMGASCDNIVAIAKAILNDQKVDARLNVTRRHLLQIIEDHGGKHE